MLILLMDINLCYKVAFSMANDEVVSSFRLHYVKIKIDIFGLCFIDNMNMLRKLKGSFTRAMN